VPTLIRPAARVGAAVAVIIFALAVAAIALYATVYRATSGCEDYAVACRQAHPFEAIIEAVFAAGGIAALTIAVVRLLKPRADKAAAVPLAIGGGLLIVWLILLQVGP
jgi:hypothetical protein